MSDLPAPETNDPRERDAGELFRPSLRLLAAPPLKLGKGKLLLLGLFAAAAAVAVAVLTLAR